MARLTDEEAANLAEQRRRELEEKGDYVSPSKRGAVAEEPLIVEPPLMHEDPSQMPILDAAARVFSDDLTPEAEELLGQMLSSNGLPSKPKGLHAKLAEIMAIAQRIPKNGIAPKEIGGYKFVQAGDAADFIRPELAKRGITMMPHEMTTIEINRSGNMAIHTLEIVWRLTDSETGEIYDLPSYGTGGDKGDKFSPKAQTNAMKYALLMGFLLSTGDDPEASSTSETEPAQGPGITITGSNLEQPQQGGRQRMATQPQIDAIRTRAGELKLTPDALAALIGSLLGGKAPDIDDLENARDKSERIIEFLGDLTFKECGTIVKAVLDLPDTDQAEPDPA